MKFLVFQHVPHEHPGLIQTYANEAGVELDIIGFWKPYRIPSVGDYDGLILMGGPMGVYEGKEVFPSRDDEVEVIQKAVDQSVPVIGFCLGSQLLAYALGAKVYPNMRDGKQMKEIGYYDVELTDKGRTDLLFDGFSSPLKVLQWHGDAFDLPKRSVLLATSKDCTHQAFRYGKNVYGMLFHNEFTPEMIEKQIQTDNKWIHDNFSLDEKLLIKQAGDYSDLMKAQCRKLLNNFISICK